MYTIQQHLQLSRLNALQTESSRVDLKVLTCTRAERLEVEVNIPSLYIKRFRVALNYAGRVSSEPAHPPRESIRHGDLF